MWRYTAGEIEALFREYGCPGDLRRGPFARAARSEVPGVWYVNAVGMAFTVREETLVFVPASQSSALVCAPR